jgi:hypothetical protein
MGALVNEAVLYACGEMLPLVWGGVLALAFILAVLIVMLWGVRWDWWRPGWLGRGISSNLS